MKLQKLVLSGIVVLSVLGTSTAVTGTASSKTTNFTVTSTQKGFKITNTSKKMGYYKVDFYNKHGKKVEWFENLKAGNNDAVNIKKAGLVSRNGVSGAFAAKVSKIDRNQWDKVWATRYYTPTTSVKNQKMICGYVK